MPGLGCNVPDGLGMVTCGTESTTTFHTPTICMQNVDPWLRSKIAAEAHVSSATQFLTVSQQIYVWLASTTVPPVSCYMWIRHSFRNVRRAQFPEGQPKCHTPEWNSFATLEAMLFQWNEDGNPHDLLLLHEQESLVSAR